MIENTTNLRVKIESASDLQSVVRTMKAMAASNITQYERSVRSLADYYSTVELGLGVCMRAIHPEILLTRKTQQVKPDVIHAIVFGSDLGLVGRFNDTVAEHAIKTLSSLSVPSEISAVGSRVYSRLADEGMSLTELFTVPSSVKAISLLVGQILVQNEERQSRGEIVELHLFYNRPTSRTIYVPVSQRLLPLDVEWQIKLAQRPWPTGKLPEVIGGETGTLPALIGEYLFVSLFRACAESLASENASRLSAMQRADKNIDELLDDLHVTYNSVRQNSIDEELFDVIAGFEALSREGRL